MPWRVDGTSQSSSEAFVSPMAEPAVIGGLETESQERKRSSGEVSGGEETAKKRLKGSQGERILVFVRPFALNVVDHQRVMFRQRSQRRLVIHPQVPRHPRLRRARLTRRARILVRSNLAVCHLGHRRVRSSTPIRARRRVQTPRIKGPKTGRRGNPRPTQSRNRWKERARMSLARTAQIPMAEIPSTVRCGTKCCGRIS